MNKLLCFLFILLSTGIYAQGEANNWYFGNKAGVNFNTSPPSAVNNGELSTNEGCSSISDENGQLIFYTDGRTVWNRNHQIMANANYFDGTGLLGDPSSTSSGLIVPHPTNTDFYYVFTVDEPHHENANAYPNQGPADANGNPIPLYTDINGSIPQDDDGYNNGLNYSLVDMTLNGGLGDIVSTEKNMPLVTYDPNDSEEIKYKCSEKITAVKGSDCNSIWVITHFIDSFYAFKIDAAGVNTNPVISEVGPTLPISSYRRSALGYMKASPNGEKILIAHNTRTYNQVGNEDVEDGGVYLTDFNPVTGDISNNIPLIEEVNAYGVEFSIQTQKAYATTTKQDILTLYQWDLESADIPNSIQPVPGANGAAATALQLAPNGKIYKTNLGSNILAVINDPEADAASVNYSESTANGAINLNGNSATFGLPPFIQSFFLNTINIINGDDDEIVTELKLCPQENYTLFYEDLPGATYTWYKNGEVIVGETSNSLDLNFDTVTTLPYSHTYKLEIEPNNGECSFKGIANVTYNDKPVANEVSYFNCSTSYSNTSSFNLEDLYTDINPNLETSSTLEASFYETLEDVENEINNIDNLANYQSVNLPHTLYVKVLDRETGCSNRAKLNLDIVVIQDLEVTKSVCATNDMGLEIFNLSEIKEQVVDSNSNLNGIFYSSQEDAILKQNPIGNQDAFENTIPFYQTIYLRLETSMGCQDIVEIHLEVFDYIPVGEDLPEIIYCLEDLPRKTTLNSGIPSALIENYTYLWSPSGETTESIETNELTSHTLRVTNSFGCSQTRNFTITASNKANFEVEVNDFSENNSIHIILNEDAVGNYQYALNSSVGPYQSESYFENLTPGVYDIYVKDLYGCGISKKTIGIQGVMKFFTPNEDGFNDRWRVLGKYERNLATAKIYIFDRFGKLLVSLNGNSRGWDGRYNGKEMPSNDYWYKVVLEDGRVLTGSLSLIR
ncbi:T9SS type B sorting domain-containing protein [Mesonia sp. MT50]|uniref:T9SS type B sorting domain-containing protein n=1 Tax=Mesonia profundi TaxID=3070998 RepID=A0ABU0ZZM5_9FLAO|nr:T9SS type B sorting domain-containing protein [Mesonia profundi]MDQ7916857.1 T9SS type B sorting domain-containing protein [Mesonia profundi]